MSFKKRRIGKRSKNWTDDETDRFYEAITIVGNDVIAIATAFRKEGKILMIGYFEKSDFLGDSIFSQA